MRTLIRSSEVGRPAGAGAGAGADTLATLGQLAERITALQTDASRSPSTRRSIATGWLTRQGDPLALAAGMTHEWITPAASAHDPWHPPLAALVHLARQALPHALHRSAATATPLLLYVGRNVWPHAWTLVTGGLIEHALLVDPPHLAGRIWAMDVALRSSAVAAVIGDATGLDMAGSRRLQLAAEAGRTLGLLARPAWDARKHLSAAATRWHLEPVRPASATAQWALTLLRAKAGAGVPASLARSTDTALGTLEWTSDARLILIPS